MVRRSVSISFQDHILQMLDEIAYNAGTNRSRVITNMITKEYANLHIMTFEQGVGVTSCLHPEQMAEYGLCNPFHKRRCMNCYPNVLSLEKAKPEWHNAVQRKSEIHQEELMEKMRIREEARRSRNE